MKYEKRGNPFRHNGKWALVYYYYDRKGNKKPKQIEGFATKKAAQEELLIREASVLNGTHVLDERIKCKEFFTHWLEEIMRLNITYNTYNSYKNVVYNYVIPEMGSRRVCTLNRTILMNFLVKVYNRHPSVSRLAKTVLVKTMDYAYEENYISHNPGEGLLLPGKVRAAGKLVALTQDEIMRLIFASYDTNIFMEVLLAVIFGVRKCELSGLKFSDIDYSGGQMHVQRALGRLLNEITPDPDLDDDDEDIEECVNPEGEWGTRTKQEKALKTKNSDRYIPIPPALVPFLTEKHRQYEQNKLLNGAQFRDDGYICCTEKGEPRCPAFYFNPFKKVLQKAGLPDMRWHDLRRTAASNLLNQEVNLVAISNYLGHATPIMTGDHYINSGPSEILAMKRMNQFVYELIYGV